MAEDRSPIVSNRILLIVVAVIVAIASLFFLWTFRGCIPVMGAPADSGYVSIYTNLDLKDTANVITRLKDLKIPYIVRENGTAIAVTKAQADEARLGLAEKNLPEGGVVGWEIFNETKMGATDFDRRIQLIRAISGELSRTIRRIEGVADARVQIVIPETRLFEITKSPVTAAVLLKITPGQFLKTDHVKGIVHLVASSVENLKPENVTVVDESGNILSTPIVLGQTSNENIGGRTITRNQVENPVNQEIIKRATSESEMHGISISGTKEAKFMGVFKKATTTTAATTSSTTTTLKKALSNEEKVLLKLKAKEEYERQLNAKAQELLNQFFPRNSVIVKVSVQFGEQEPRAKTSKVKIHSASGSFLTNINKISTIVLIDNQLDLTDKTKKLAYQTLSLVIPYEKKRGDVIILKQVPFHYAEETSEAASTGIKPESPKFNLLNINDLMQLILWVVFAIFVLLIALLIIQVVKPKQKKVGYDNVPGAQRNMSQSSEAEAVDTINSIKNVAKENPERLANLLKKWLQEEES